ncbi:MAG TPA: hypothetical protein DEB46_01090 [Myxococcales bacterium]|nr:hypothetical protein [Myxococcales bacterium]HBU46879.1 hypothetical protein [Myxococcales bacterium]
MPMMMALVLILAVPGDLNPPVVRHEPPALRAKDGGVYLWFEVRDDSKLFGQALFVRTGPGDPWRRQELIPVATGWFEAKLRRPGAFQYFFEVFDEEGNGPSRVGTPQAPFRAPVLIGELDGRRPWDPPPPPKIVEPLPEQAPPTVVSALRDLWSIPEVRRNSVYTAAGLVSVGLSYGAWRMLRSPGGQGQVTLVPVAP